jgi:type I restriction enzyme M protein
MEACLLITTTKKKKERKGKILIMNAVKEVKQDKNIGYLEAKHIDKIYKSFLDFKNEEGFSRVVDNNTVLTNKASLNIAQYVSNVAQNDTVIKLNDTINTWEENSKTLKKSMNELFEILK